MNNQDSFPPEEGPRVLVVDDEAPLRRFYRKVLNRFGYQVREAVDGLDALEQLELELPDLILMDLTMPRMDGACTLERVRRLHPDLPVILASGYGEPGVSELSPYEAFLQKPFSSKELLEHVRAMLMVGLKEPLAS